MERKKVAFYTLGCKLNFSETSTIARSFQEEGFDRVEFEEVADIYVINTCSVTENADKQFKQYVKKAMKLNDKAFVAAVGCYAQLKPQEIATIPGVDAVLGAAEKFRLVELLDGFVRPQSATVIASDIEKANKANGCVDRKPSELGAGAGKFHLQTVIDDASDNGEIIEKIVDAALHRIRQHEIPSSRERFQEKAIDHFTIEPEHFFIKAFPGVFVKIIAG